MDYIVHINAGDDSVKPIVLHLLPGEETIFNLVVVNDGDPSYLSLLASDSIFKAVRFRRSEDHVDTTQIIPVFARMPLDQDRLDGEIILTSRNGESRVPVSILLDTGGSGIESISHLKAEQQGRSGGSRKVSSRTKIRDIATPEKTEIEEYEEEAALNSKGDIDPDTDSDTDEDGEQVVEDGEDRGLYGGREDADADDGPSVTARDINSDDEGDIGHIVFSRDHDLEKYRSSRRPRRVEDLSSSNNIRANHRIDDRFTSRTAVEDIDDLLSHRQEGLADRFNEGYIEGYNESYNEQSNPFEPDRKGQAYPRERDLENLEGYSSQTGREASFELGGLDEGTAENGSSDKLQPDEVAGYLEEDDSRAFGEMQIIPAAIFLALVAVLVLTFITETIPEFPGALVSSILIVTLIIYGAATLLKA